MAAHSTFTMSRGGGSLFKRLAALLGTFAMVFTCIVTFNSVAHASTAAGVGTINASIVDDSGSAVSLGGANDTAQMSFPGGVQNQTKWYVLHVELTNMPSTETKTVQVTLPIGMKFQYTNITTFLNTVSQFKNDVASSPAPTYAHAGLTSEAGYTFNNGVYTFTLNAGVQATTVDIPISFDGYVMTDTITNAAQVKLTSSAGSTQDMLETVKITRSTGVGVAYHSDPNQLYYVNPDIPSIVTDLRLKANSDVLNVLVSRETVTVKTSDPRVVITNTDTTGAWSLDASDSANGNYVFTRVPLNGAASFQVVDSNSKVPFAVTFPSSASPAFAASDVASVYIAAGTLTYRQFTTSDGTGNIGSSVSSYPATDTNFIASSGGNANYGHRYQLAVPGSLVYVNYPDNATVVNLAAPRDLSADITRQTNVDAGNSDPSLNVATGYMGSFFAGNAGGVDSPAQTVEIHFSNTNYGILSTNIPLASGNTVSSMDYQINGDPTWHTVSVNLTGAAMSGSAGNYAYVSFATLGVTSNDYITGLRYNAGVFPAFMRAAGANSGNAGTLAYYGKWLGAKTATAQATIEIKDTTGSGGNDTGVGTVTTTNNSNTMSGNIGGGTTTVVAAGNSLNFSITNTGDSNDADPAGFATNDPVYYLRSPYKDENGNLLPVQNIKLVTDTTRGSVDLFAGSTVSAWEVDEDGDGKPDVAIYKIDTSTVPDGSQLLTSTSVNPTTGAIYNPSTVLSWSVPTTQLTPTQSFNIRDMVFIRDAVDKTNAFPTTSGSNDVQLTAASSPTIYSELQHGENWSTGLTWGNSTAVTTVGTVNMVQSILVTSQIQQNNGKGWLTWRQGDVPIAVGTSANSGFQLKSNIINNAGATVTGTQVYIPIPRANDNWGSLQTGTPQLSLMLKGPATVSLSGGAVGSYTVLYGVNVTPTDDGTTLQGYTWVDASQVTDWSQVNCIQLVANDIEDQANIQVVLNAKADSAQTSPALVEGLVDIWHPTYYQNFTSPTGVYQGWYSGADFGVQSALSGIKGRLFNDVNVNGLYDGASEDLSAVWTLDVYRMADFVVSGLSSTPLQELTTNPDGTYEIVDLLSKANNYVLVATNPSSSTLMFTRTVTRAAGNGSGQYGEYGANTFSSGDSDAHGVSLITAALTDPGQTPPLDVPNTGTFNIGVTDKVNTTLTFQSADSSKGTISGPGVTGGKASSSELPVSELDATLIPTVAAATGYTYAGWVQVAAGAAAPAWNATATVTAAEAAGSPLPFGGGDNTYGFDSYDYYAVFSANQYGVSFDSNKPVSASTNVSGLMANQTATFGEAFTLNANGFTLPGYTFTGWNTAADGSGTSYTDAQVFASWSTASDVTLYAQWTANQYTVSFNANKPSTATGSVSGSMSDETVIFDQDATLTANAFTLPGYTFTGWNTAADGSGTVYADSEAISPYTTVGNTVLYAQWTANQYTVSYVANEPSDTTVDGSVEEDTVTYGDNYEVSENGFTIDTYTFTGWNTAADGSGTSYAAGYEFTPYDIAHNLTLYALWTKDSTPETPDTDESTQQPELAETGSTVTGVFLVAGTFVLLAGLVLAIRRMRKAK